jgi:hypothetical protein
MTIYKKTLRALSSVRMAVVVLLALAVVASVGTIYEAEYDAEVAQKLVYRSWYMYTVLGVLCVNLIAVMVSRWPWRRHHMSFVLAHIGILVLLTGAYITSSFGVDGSISFAMGDTRQSVTITGQELSVYGSFDGSTYQRLAYQPVDFLRSGPPLELNVGSDVLRVIQAPHFAIRDSEIVATDRSGDGPALRVNLQNNFANQTLWLRRDARRAEDVQNLGPAQLVLSDGHYQPSGKTEAVISPGKTPQSLKVDLYHAGDGRTGTHELHEGDSLPTGWAGMTLRLLRYLPHAQEKVQFKDNKGPAASTTPAIQIQFLGEKHWLGLNSQLRLFTHDTAYQVNYNNSQIPLPFGLTLKGFRVGHYQGTQRAASYESDVLVNGKDPVTISMNNPLKFGGYTFYQASFEQDEQGRPTLSVLSVNYDPGRFIKYLGSFLIVLGAILLFYFRHHFRRKA